MSEKDWDEAPNWAQYRTIDSDGTITFHEMSPEAIWDDEREKGWWKNGGKLKRGKYADWRISVRKRPAQIKLTLSQKAAEKLDDILADNWDDDLLEVHNAVLAALEGRDDE